MNHKNKILFSILMILSISVVSAISIHKVHNTNKKILNYNNDIDWDI